MPLQGIETSGQHIPLWKRAATPAALLLLWLVLYAAAIATPPVLDDADATHAQAARAMLRSHDFVILRVDGVPYLEKAPLPYWIAAASMRCFGVNSFAVHLPLALTVLALALLAWRWGRRAWDTPHVRPDRTGFLAGLFTLTSFGVFLFTRVFIPDAMLALALALTLYLQLRAMEPDCPSPRLHAYAAWAALACAVLTKGLVALVFLFGSWLLYLMLTRDFTRLYRLRLGSGLLLMLALAAPWHVLAALRFPGSPAHHGFLWFYFINEHVLRFLGRREPRDYNKLPALAYWLLHLAWLFPWSLFAPAALLLWARERTRATDARERDLSRLDLMRSGNSRQPRLYSFSERSAAMLAVFSTLVLVFFSLSTNQEYYTLPAYLPLLLLLAWPLARMSSAPARSLTAHALTAAFACLTLLGVAIAAVLTYALWLSRHAPASTDIGELMAHRAVGNYTLSMSHFFDLTSSAFAALRLPALLAAAAFALGPVLAWSLHRRARSLAALFAVGLTSATVLVAAHLAFGRFAPLLSSYDFAQRILTLEAQHAVDPDAQVLIFGDQALGSSLPLYLDHNVLLVDGRSTSLLFGSTLPGAASVFLTHDQLQAQWGSGPRKLLFVPEPHAADVGALHLSPLVLLFQESGKSLYTDRPLAPPTTPPNPSLTSSLPTVNPHATHSGSPS